jgi:hypothetical protein
MLIRAALRRYIAERRWQRLVNYARIRAEADGELSEEEILRRVEEFRHGADDAQ